MINPSVLADHQLHYPSGLYGPNLFGFDKQIPDYEPHLFRVSDYEFPHYGRLVDARNEVLVI